MKKVLNDYKFKIKRFFYLCIASLILITITMSESHSKNIDENYHQLYLEVIQGKKKIEQLTPNEKEKVLDIHQLTKKSCGNLREDCERACRAANALKDSSNNLASCANKHDYSEDCQRKFKSVKNDFDSYDQAISQASGRCD